jgi:hypothetical protein
MHARHMCIQALSFTATAGTGRLIMHAKSTGVSLPEEDLACWSRVIRTVLAQARTRPGAVHLNIKDPPVGSCYACVNGTGSLFPERRQGGVQTILGSAQPPDSVLKIAIDVPVGSEILRTDCDNGLEHCDSLPADYGLHHNAAATLEPAICRSQHFMHCLNTGRHCRLREFITSTKCALIRRDAHHAHAYAYN